MKHIGIPRRLTTLFIVTAAVLVPIGPAVGGSAASIQDPESPRYRAASALAELLTDSSADAGEFLDGYVAASVIARVPRADLLAALATIRGEVIGLELEGFEPTGPHSARILLGPSTEGAVVHLALEEDPPQRIADVWIAGGPRLDPDAGGAETEPITWETLAARVEAAATAGFTGAVLVVRDGEVVLKEGFGVANREAGHRVTPSTVFAIGSTPIDFTKAGILLLMEDGLLRGDETLGAFFDDVPDDKRAITVDHLMTGRSGLRDFHDVPADRDPDHAWIDRAEAVRRILGQELLFEPGTGSEHSHSAWGLLAAILEIRSGKSYAELTRARLFEPAGMADTGFFGEEIDPERLAIGYGDLSDGDVNAPPWWGPTSWLVMGSGGMVSTLEDMLRWNRALRSGRILSEASLARFWSPRGAILAGGDMYGFEILYTEGPGSLMILTSNAVDDSNRSAFMDLGRALADLVIASAAEGR